MVKRKQPYRIFDGKRFKYYVSAPGKAAAQMEKANLKSKGFKVRIIKDPVGGKWNYAVYCRR